MSKKKKRAGREETGGQREQISLRRRDSDQFAARFAVQVHSVV